MEDIRISGSGNIRGGEYASITVSGIGKCSGTVGAQSMVVSGTFKVQGGTECRILTVNGTLKLDPTSVVEKLAGDYEMQ